MIISSILLSILPIYAIIKYSGWKIYQIIISTCIVLCCSLLMLVPIALVDDNATYNELTREKEYLTSLILLIDTEEDNNTNNNTTTINNSNNNNESTIRYMIMDYNYRVGRVKYNRSKWYNCPFLYNNLINNTEFIYIS